MKNLVNINTPFLQAGGEANKLILSPMLRYAAKNCCDNKDHITNRRDKKRFLAAVGDSVHEMKDNIKDFVFGEKIKSFKVLSSLRLTQDALHRGCVK
jgi:hypothetical protein